MDRTASERCCTTVVLENAYCGQHQRCSVLSHSTRVRTHTLFPVSNKTSIVFVPTDVGRIGIGICHDIRFPELAMLLVQHHLLYFLFQAKRQQEPVRSTSSASFCSSCDRLCQTRCAPDLLSVCVQREHGGASHAEIQVPHSSFFHFSSALCQQLYLYCTLPPVKIGRNVGIRMLRQLI
jgi:hypothetical protein